MKPSPAIEHAEVSTAPATIISNDDELKDLLEHLRSSGRFGYDSEFIGEHSYSPKLCLIQVATTQRVGLIDPLQTVNLEPFWRVLADPAVQKIVHAGLPDLEPVMRHLGRPPRAVFDTQIVAAFAGLSYPMGLGSLLQEVSGVELTRSGRSMKFSQWDHRPLTPGQLQYAADDVRYLPLLQQALSERATVNKNMDWAREECDSLSRAELYTFDPQSQRLKVRGVERLSCVKRAVLRALVAWRDSAAREHDVPPRSLLRDDVLFSLAVAPIQSVGDLKRVSGLPRPVEQEFGPIIVETTRQAIEASKTADPGIESPTPRRCFDRDEHRQQIDALWQTIKDRALERSIDPAIVTSKRELDSMIRNADRGVPAPAARIMSGWRRELLGPLFDSI